MSTSSTFAEARDELIARGNRIQKLRGTPRDDALRQAMSERPDLAAIVRDRDSSGRPLPTATTSTPAPASPHAELLGMAETIRKAEPTLSAAGAYLKAAEERPDLLDRAIAERPAMPVDTFQEQHRRDVATFAERAPAAFAAHAKLEAFAEQIRMRAGNYVMSPEVAYLEATREHPVEFAAALAFIEGQKVLSSPERPVAQSHQATKTSDRMPVTDLTSAKDVLSQPRTWPKSALPKAGEVPNLDEWMKLARKAAKPGESVEDAFRRIYHMAGADTGGK